MLWCISWEVPRRFRTVQYFDYINQYLNNEKRRGIENKPNVDKIRKKNLYLHDLSMYFFMLGLLSEK